MERQQIFGLSKEENYDSLMTLTEEVKEELNLWMQNLRLTKENTLVLTSIQPVIFWK